MSESTGFAGFPQGMDFLKQFWAQGAAGAAASNPAMTPHFAQAMGQYLSPTLDAAELEKRISDLKTVLQFMEFNTQLLRQSLQALEVQHATLQAMKQMATAQPATGDNPAAPWIAAWQAMMQGAGNGGAAEAVVKPAAKTTAKKAAAKKAPKKQVS